MASPPRKIAVWQCGVCFDDYEPDKEKPITIDGDKLCRDCGQSMLLERFEAFLANEFEPARWGERVLDARDKEFEGLFDEHFMTRWNAAMVERDMPIKERVYCRHLVLEANAKVGEVAKQLTDVKLASENDKADLAQAGSGEATKKELLTQCGQFISGTSTDGVPTLSSCPKCQGSVCLNCKAAVRTDDKHDACNTETSPTADETFSDMKRGRDYQLCPKCGISIERKDGCNHIACTSCGEQFCFICAKTVKADSGHWRRENSGCPRYNQPEDANAEFDNDIEAALDSDDDDDDLPLVSAVEIELRTAVPDQAFPEIDDIAITNEMVAATPVGWQTRVRLAMWRYQYFVKMAVALGHTEDTAHPRHVGPSEWNDFILCCYRITRMVIELFHRPADWDAAAALERYRGYWEEFQRLRHILPDTWSEQTSERTRADVVMCLSWKQATMRKLEAADTEAGWPELRSDAPRERLWGDELIDEVEQEVRGARPDEAFPAIDEIPITEIMVRDAPIDWMAQNVIRATRRWFFLNLAWKYELVRFRGGQGPAPPWEHVEAMLYCYRILRMLIELYSPPAGWEASEALERFRGYWTELERLRRVLPEDWNEEGDVCTREHLECCEEWHDSTEQRLEALVRAHNG